MWQPIVYAIVGAAILVGLFMLVARFKAAMIWRGDVASFQRFGGTRRVPYADEPRRRRERDASSGKRAR